MSKHETWRTRMYWEKVGGTLVEEYMIVPRSKDGTVAQRLIDGLIILGGEKCIVADQSIEVRGRDVIAVQTKANRLGMYLMGQALFSRELLQEQGPSTIRSVAICGRGDTLMEQLCAAHEIEVVTIPETEKRALD